MTCDLDQGEIEAVARELADWATEPGEIAPPYRWKKFQHQARCAIQALNAYRTATGVGDGKADARARARLHALRRSHAFAVERQAASNRQADKYAVEKPDDPYWERSERCAAHEARHIAENIAQFMKEADKESRLGLTSRPALNAMETGE